ERAAAFAVDSLASTRPIEYPVRSPEEAEGMFDVLTYEKGASVLRMLEQYLGVDGFRAGIRRYLAEHQYANAETGDLWDAIEAATGEPVRRIMDSWIFQGGYPLVGVETAAGGVRLDQRRFAFAGADDAPGGDWPVPVLASAGGDQPVRVLLDGASAELSLAGEPVVVNAGGHGFYRARYSPELLASLRRSLDRLAPVERALLVDDTWAAVLAGDTPASAFLELAGGFSAETDRTVWATLAGPVGAIDHILDGQAREHLRAWVRDLTGSALVRLGWEPDPDDDELTRQLRGIVIGAAGVLGDDHDVQARARLVHNAYLDDPTSVDPDVASAVLGVTASTGTSDDYATMADRALASSSPQEALRYLYALARFPQADLAERTLAMALTDEVRSQNAPYLVLRLLANRETGALAWAFIEAHWDAVNQRFPDNSIPVMLSGITSLSTPELGAAVESFLADHPVHQGRRSVEQHRERRRVNLALRQREAGPVANWLADWSR
ncbi:MAG: ERAP1-like C-terminal domain-containing protein, partial [Acidimicrobiales bacterium]